MPFVDFMIIGAMKSGTTSLSQLLSGHPEVCFCKKKEPHFFSKSPNWRDRIEEYRELYSPVNNQICGEASTTYTFYPIFNKNTCQAIYDFNPNIKLIYIMRDPIDRIVSHYMHAYTRGYVSDSFEKSVLTRPRYINISRYSTQIKPYIERFGKDQVLLLTFEEFISDRRSFLDKVSTFLNIDASLFNLDSNIHENKSVGEYRPSVKMERLEQNAIIQKVKYLLPAAAQDITFKAFNKVNRRKLDAKPVVSMEIGDAIRRLLRLDILEMEKMLGRELNEWVRAKKHEVSSD